MKRRKVGTKQKETRKTEQKISRKKDDKSVGAKRIQTNKEKEKWKAKIKTKFIGGEMGDIILKSIEGGKTKKIWNRDEKNEMKGQKSLEKEKRHLRKEKD